MSLAERAQQTYKTPWPCAVRKLLTSLPPEEAEALEALASQAVNGDRSWVDLARVVRQELGKGPGYGRYQAHYRDRSCSCH